MIGSAKTREQLEALFESGDQPTAQDFADLIASFLLVDGSDLPDPLPAIDGSALTDIATADPLPAVDGSALTGIDIQEWDQVLPAPNYATTLTFTHAGDLTGTYIKDRRVRLTVDGGFEYSDVVSSVYASGADTTTVTIADAMSSNLLTAADVSVFTPLEAGGAISPLMIGSIGAQFRAHEADTPDMTVVVDAGRVQNGVTLTEVAQQATATITAPTTNPRIDRVVIDNVTGVVSVIAGTEAASPVAPALTAGKIAVTQVLLQTATVAITNGMITDERNIYTSVTYIGTPISVSGAEIEFAGIPSRVTKITISLSDVSTNGTEYWELDAGDAVDYSSSIFSGAYAQVTAPNAIEPGPTGTSAARLTSTVIATSKWSGLIELTLIDATTNTWAFTSMLADNGQSDVCWSAGNFVNTAGAINKLKIITTGGTGDTFDAGKANIRYG